MTVSTTSQRVAWLCRGCSKTEPRLGRSHQLADYPALLPHPGGTPLRHHGAQRRSVAKHVRKHVVFKRLALLRRDKPATPIPRAVSSSRSALPPLTMDVLVDFMLHRRRRRAPHRPPQERVVHISRKSRGTTTPASSAHTIACLVAWPAGNASPVCSEPQMPADVCAGVFALPVCADRLRCWYYWRMCAQTKLRCWYYWRMCAQTKLRCWYY